MIEIIEVITVDQPIEITFKFVSDFSFIEQWDPGVLSSEKITKGGVQPGTQYRLKLRYGLFNIQTDYTIEAYEPPSRVVLKGRGDTFGIRDTILFTSLGDKTNIEYSAQLTFDEPNPFAENILKRVFPFIGKSAMKGLKSALAIEREPLRPLEPEAGITLIDKIADTLVVPGMLGFSKLGYGISKKFWKANPYFLTGKNVVITGATSGIGKMAAFGLAKLDAHLTIIARNEKKAMETRDEIITSTGNKHVEYILGDLSLMKDVRNVGAELVQRKKIIDVLIHNAGALFPERIETQEGLEKSFAVNLLGVYLLTRHVMTPLSKAAHPRIITVSSGGMYTEKIDCNDLQNRCEPFNGAKAYARAKRGLVILTETWAKSLEDKGFRCHAMHPGWVDTPGLARSLPGFYTLTRKILRTPEQGADTLVWLASAKEPGHFSGGFWLDRRLHKTHIFKHTQESEQEREELLLKLSDMAKAYP